MLTPQFSCSQTADSVIISLYVPSVRASDVEIHVDRCVFSVHINPYFLRLSLPRPVLEDDASSAQYDPSSGYLKVTLTKETPGEEFADLDLLSKLLAPSTAPKEEGPSIEVIDEPDGLGQLTRQTEQLNLEHDVFLKAAENDWRLPQSLPEDASLELATTRQRKYGFLDRHSGYFCHVAHTENEVNELGPDAEILDEDERRRRGEERAERKFDEEYYVADFVHDEEIQELIRWKHPYCEPVQSFEFSENEKLTMLRLPRKEYLTTPMQTRSLYLTLVTLLFSATYDTRTTLADPTSESAWTLSILTPAFASLSPARSSVPDNTVALHEALVPSYQRALAFPLYRSFALCERCRLDVADILAGGRRIVLRMLLSMKSVLDRHDVYYLYSKVWIDDFCVWAQSVASDQALRALAAETRKVNIEKKDLGWRLDELEQTARDAIERAPDSDDEDEGEVERMRPTML